jgi:hypothetical protein
MPVPVLDLPAQVLGFDMILISLFHLQPHNRHLQRPLERQAWISQHDHLPRNPDLIITSLIDIIDHSIIYLINKLLWIRTRHALIPRFNDDIRHLPAFSSYNHGLDRRVSGNRVFNMRSMELSKPTQFNQIISPSSRNPSLSPKFIHNRRIKLSSCNCFQCRESIESTLKEITFWYAIIMQFIQIVSNQLKARAHLGDKFIALPHYLILGFKRQLRSTFRRSDDWK